MKMLRTLTAAVAAAAMACALAACGTTQSADGRNPDGTVTISLAGWTLATRPEFQALADAYHASHPEVSVELKEYSADDYDKQLIADLSAGKSPDVFPMKNLRMYYTYAEPGALADLTDVAAGYADDEDIRGLKDYEIDGKTYALPYRQDVWVLFYNKTMLEKAGVDAPDGTWTWDDYEAACKRLKSALPKAGYKDAYPTYHHTSWQSMPQGIAMAQQQRGTAREVFLSGDYAYLKPMYQRLLRMQDQELTIAYNTVSSSKTTYQSQFGTQKAALLPMATWYLGPLADQQASGDADDFDWGVTLLPQRTREDIKQPKSFGDPTGFAVSSHIGGAKLEAAKDFVRWAAGEDGALALAKTGTLPAYFSDDVLDAFFAKQGLPQDEMSREAITASSISPENPVGEATQTVQDELNIAHTSILSETKPLDDALAGAARAINGSGLLPGASH